MIFLYYIFCFLSSPIATSFIGRARIANLIEKDDRQTPELPMGDDQRVTQRSWRACACNFSRYTGRTRVDSQNVILILVLRCLRKIIVPIICWVASETLNRQCSTSESLSNLEASFGLISRFESIAHRYNYLFRVSVCLCVYVCLCTCGNSSIILLFCFSLSFLIITYSVRLNLTLHFV